MMKLDLSFNGGHYKFEQIRDEMIRNIESGHFKTNSLLPSITEVCEQYGLSRVTVSRAYMHLKNRGYAFQIIGKGFFVSDRRDERIKVLLIFNKLSYYKKNTYYGIVNGLGRHAKVDLQVHHYDVKILDEIISENLGKYQYYVVMPHFKYEAEKDSYLSVLRKIPLNKLILLDKDLPELVERHNSIYQDFHLDIYNALTSLLDLFVKYDTLKLVFPSDCNHPLEIIEGVKRFCKEYAKEFCLIENTEGEVLKSRTAYLIIEEVELAELIKSIRSSDFKIGSDIGIISFNETVLKEISDITVVSTDFSGMGLRVAQMILDGYSKQVRNPFQVIRRSSF